MSPVGANKKNQVSLPETEGKRMSPRRPREASRILKSLSGEVSGRGRDERARRLLVISRHL